MRDSIVPQFKGSRLLKDDGWYKGTWITKGVSRARGVKGSNGEQKLAGFGGVCRINPKPKPYEP